MIIDQPFSYSKTIAKLAAEAIDYQQAHARSLELFVHLHDIIKQHSKSEEFEFLDTNISYNTLYLNVKLTERGIFNSVEQLVSDLTKLLGSEPTIRDNTYAKGKSIEWGACYSEPLRAGLYIVLHGNSKCQLIVTETEMIERNTYRVDCGEIQTIKELTYVPSLNAIGSDNG
jgi:hypothetical protein